MKALRFIILALGLIAVLPSSAQVEISKTEKITSNDDVFIDMAVSAAKTSVADGNLPCGAVVILNGAWRSTGMPSNEITAEEVAINKSRTNSLSNGAIYTVVQPTTNALEAIVKSGLKKVYYAIDSDAAIAAGIYPASAYESNPASNVVMIQIPYNEADDLVKSWKK